MHQGQLLWHRQRGWFTHTHAHTQHSQRESEREKEEESQRERERDRASDLVALVAAPNGKAFAGPAEKSSSYLLYTQGARPSSHKHTRTHTHHRQRKRGTHTHREREREREKERERQRQRERQRERERETETERQRERETWPRLIAPAGNRLRSDLIAQPVLARWQVHGGLHRQRQERTRRVRRELNWRGLCQQLGGAALLPTVAVNHTAQCGGTVWVRACLSSREKTASDI